MTTSECWSTRELLVAWLARDVEHARWQAQAVHATWCAECAKWIFAQGWLWGELGDWEDAPVPAELDRAVRRLAERHGSRGAEARRRGSADEV